MLEDTERIVGGFSFDMVTGDRVTGVLKKCKNKALFTFLHAFLIDLSPCHSSHWLFLWPVPAIRIYLWSGTWHSAVSPAIL